MDRKIITSIIHLATTHLLCSQSYTVKPYLTAPPPKEKKKEKSAYHMLFCNGFGLGEGGEARSRGIMS